MVAWQTYQQLLPLNLGWFSFYHLGGDHLQGGLQDKTWQEDQCL